MRATVVAALVISCAASTGTEPAPHAGGRTYRMGFSALPPRLTILEVPRYVDIQRDRTDFPFVPAIGLSS